MKRSLQARCSHKRQSGQGLVGFIVAATFILVPATLATNYLARVGDANHKNLQAARYSTWERTVWSETTGKYNYKASSEFQHEIDQRIFANQLKPIDSSGKTTKESSAPNALKNFDPMLTKYELVESKQASLLEIPTEPGNKSNHLNRLDMTNGKTPGDVAGVAIELVSDALDLQNNGFYKSQVGLRLSSTRVLQEQLKTDENAEGYINAKAVNAMLVGAWNANSSANVAKTVRKTVPTDQLNKGPIQELREVADKIQPFQELGDLEFGHVEPDVVPCHRLAGKNSGSDLTCL